MLVALAVAVILYCEVETTSIISYCLFSSVAAGIPLTAPLTAVIVTKSPSIAPCPASVTVTVGETLTVVKPVIFPAAVDRVGVMSYQLLFW